MIHTEDDYNIPHEHTHKLVWHAVNGAVSSGCNSEQLETERGNAQRDLGAAGSAVVWKTENGLNREEILKHGLQDVVMGYSIVTMAVMRIFAAVEVFE